MAKKQEPLEVREVEEKEGPEKWEIENWADSVVKAQEILNDPEKMKLIQPILDNKKRALEGLPVKNMEDLKARTKMVNEAEEDED